MPINLIFPLLWLFVLVLMLSFFLRVRFNLNKPQHWQKISGKIMQFSWTRKEGFLWADVEYHYTLGEINYVGRKLHIASPFYSPRVKKLRQALYNIAVAYENDEEIPVYYTEQDPGEAVLIRFIPPRLNLIIILLFLLIILHGAVLIF